LRFFFVFVETNYFFNALEVGKSVLVTKIADTSKLPRTTVGFLLKKLKQRGLVEQIKVGRHKEWQIKSLEKISQKLQQIYFKFNNVSAKDTLGSTVSKNDEYLDLELDVIFFADKVYFIDVVDEKIIFIKNKRLVKTFKNLFYLAESFGRKVDLNNYLKDLIRKK